MGVVKPELLVISWEVREAMAAGQAVVALESTVIAHGLPWPDNLALARALEGHVRDAGAIPATIALREGVLRVGLHDDELTWLATEGRSIPKVSRRDLPVALARGKNGATTVAATMLAAHLAGIRVMGTGGLGGVHRGHHTDVSADLPELARTPVLVVSSGAKAILDLPATLEWLETWGIPVVGYGTDRFPAFWCRDSGLPLEARVDTPDEAAAIFRHLMETGLGTGMLVCVPCPEEVALSREEMETVITAAVEAADREGITGKDVTPWLLRRVADQTEGRSVTANLALLKNNARVAAEIAGALGKVEV